MRKFLLPILLVLLGLPVMAQQSVPSDSMYLFGQASRAVAWAHSGATQLLFRNFKNIAISQLYASRERGDFRRSQQADRRTVVGFHTDGIKTLGRFTLAGQFDFEKGWEDSVAWWLSGEYDAAEPYYFFAGRKGSVETQLYNLSATATYNLWKNKLYLGTSGNYRYNWSLRSVDPRQDIKAFSTKLQPELTARFNHHLTGIGFIWGRGSEQGSIGYKNTGTAANTTYQDQNLYWSLGYGHLSKLGRYMQRYHETSGFTAHYAGQWHTWNVQAMGGYELKQEDISKDTTSTRQKHELYAFVQQERSYGRLLISKAGTRHHQQLELQFASQGTLNWTSEAKGTSFQSTAADARLTYRNLWPLKAGLQLELGAGADYNEQFKQDILAAHNYELRALTPHVYAGVYLHTPNKSWLSVSVMPSFRYALSQDLTVPPTQVTYYTQGIIYSDYLFWQQNSLGVHTKFNYIQKETVKRGRLGATLQFNWQQAGNRELPNLPALYVPLGNRWNASASINLYL